MPNNRFNPLPGILMPHSISYADRHAPSFDILVTFSEGFWTAECDVLGLVTEEKSYEALVDRVWLITPELAELNKIDNDEVCLRFLHNQTRHLRLV